MQLAVEGHPFIARVKALPFAEYIGYVRKVSSGYIEADGPFCTVGDICEVTCDASSVEGEDSKVLAEVVSVEDNKTVLMPFKQSVPILPDSRLRVLPRNGFASVGNAFAGRLVDSLGRALDGEGDIFSENLWPLSGKILSPLERSGHEETLETGIRALDGLLTVGEGQRLGVFAASGVGKTTLITQLAEQIECDRCVMCLVGERGREVEAFWTALSEQDNMDRYSCVAATSDMSAALRTRAVYQAVALAEYWREQGESVLLLIDSVTRFAMALREIGLAAGAPPTLRAYTPNVFDALPRIVERCGGAKSGGSITAIMTILSETDDVDDPIVEVMKSLLDGHIILSRQLAEQGHFPAIDVTKSVSRQSDRLMSESHLRTAQDVLSMLSTYEDSKVMIESGIYKVGSNKLIDKAVACMPDIADFLQQQSREHSDFDSTVLALSQISQAGSAHA